MLVLSRKTDESIVIDGRIEVTVVQIEGGRVRLGITAPREVSIRRGYDPREYILLAAGGAGPLHIGALARELNIPLVIVPRFASVFCALGGLQSDLRQELVTSFVTALDGLDFERANALLGRLRARPWRLDRPFHHARAGLSDLDIAASGPVPSDVCRATWRLDGLSTCQAERRTAAPPAPALRRGPAVDRRLISGVGGS